MVSLADQIEAIEACITAKREALDLLQRLATGGRARKPRVVIGGIAAAERRLAALEAAAATLHEAIVETSLRALGTMPPRGTTPRTRRYGDPIAVMARRRAIVRETALRRPGCFGYARKHDVAMAVRAGVVTKAEVMTALGVSPEELAGWLAAFDAACAGATASPPRERAA